MTVDEGFIEVDAKVWFDSQRSKFERIEAAVVRELVQNCCDSLLRSPGGRRRDIHVEVGVNRRLLIRDNGRGMSRDDLQKLTVVGHSGTAEARRAGHRADRSGSALDGRPILGELEGRFGVGFYVTALVAEEVRLRTLHERDDGTREAWCWRYSPQTFRWEIELDETPLAEVGTEVSLTVLPQFEHLLDERKLASLVGEVAEFVSFPIFVGYEPRPSNRVYGPWDAESAPGSSFESYLVEAGLARHDELTLVLPMPFDAEAGLGGVLFAARSQAEGGLRLYLNRYYVNQSQSYLPKGFRFLSGVICTSGLDVNESRERVLENDALETLRERLRAWILYGCPARRANGGLVGFLAGREGAKARTAFLARHGRELFRLAEVDGDVMDALGDVLDLPLSSGSPIKVADLRRVAGGGPIHYVDDEMARVHHAPRYVSRSVPVVDATDPATAAFLHAAAARFELGLRRIGPNLDETKINEDRWRVLERVLLSGLPGRLATLSFEARGDNAAVILDVAKLRRAPAIALIETLLGGHPFELLRRPMSDYAPNFHTLWRFGMESVRDQIFSTAKTEVQGGGGVDVVINVDHQLSRMLAEAAGVRPRVVIQASMILLSHALQQMNLAWEEQDRAFISRGLTDALTNLVAGEAATMLAAATDPPATTPT
jgi:hypothetical protein